MSISRTNDIYGNEWINAKKFGFIPDGETPNDDVMQTYIAEFADIPLYFGKGVYAFERSIDFPHSMFIYMDPGAELKCIAKEPLEYFITMQKDSMTWYDSWEGYGHRSFIKGGKINANYCAKVALGLHGGLHTAFSDFAIYNVLEKGIVTEIGKGVRTGCYRFENIYLYNAGCVENTVGIYDNTADNIFVDCTVVSFQTGIVTSGGKFERVSCWIGGAAKALIPNSLYAHVFHGGQAVFNSPMIDTYRTGFRVSCPEGGNTATLAVTDLVWITNDTFYTRGQWSAEDNMQRDYPMLVFEAESEDCRITVDGMYLPWRDWDFAFSNIPLPNSSFTRVRYEGGWRPWEDMNNFRDDTARMKEGKDLFDWSDVTTC